MGKFCVAHGALQYCEAKADDVKPGHITSFPQSVKLKKDEIVVFSWVVYKSKAQRNKIWKKMMSSDLLKDIEKMPFDGKRMFWGGFTPLVRL